MALRAPVAVKGLENIPAMNNPAPNTPPEHFDRLTHFLGVWFWSLLSGGGGFSRSRA